MMEFNDSDIFGDYVESADYIDEEWVDREIEKQCKEQEEQRKREWDKKHNIRRDKRGRLNKGALLASKNNCSEVGIQLRYDSGMSPKEIVDCMKCSKSTVYSVIKKHKNKKSKSAILENSTDTK
jgi:transposase